MAALLLPDPGGALGVWVRDRVPGLVEHAQLELFASSVEEVGGLTARAFDALRPRDHERVLVPIGDEPECAPLVPWLRSAGGTVWLFAWELTRLARAVRPALAGGGLGARIAAWREGGLSAARSLGQGSPLNRSVVRFGDAFLVADEELRGRILVERNAPTPIAVVQPDDVGGVVQALQALPAPRSNRKSLISTAIEAADRAREARREESAG